MGASSDSLVSDSLNDGSSSVDSSGSSGSFMNNWLWVALILCLLCVKGGLLAALCKPKPKPKKKPAPAPAPAPAPEPEAVVEPLIPAMMPLATTSTVVPSYGYTAAPATTAYAPTSMAYAPTTTAYAPTTYAAGAYAPAGVV